MIKSEIFNGSKFESEEVKRILEAAYRNRTRLRLFYGKDGKVWNKEYDVCGYIGRSTGLQKSALLIHNKRSLGGGGIMTDRIVGIYDTKTKKCLYWNALYTIPQTKITYTTDTDLLDKGYKFQVIIDKKLYSNHKTEMQAKRLADFMTAKRFSK